MAMLEVHRLNKTFGKLVVSRNVDLQVEAGERHIIIGPNGAGKTTLINQIGGQLTSDSGRVALGGQDITPLPAYQRARRGLARTFQKNTLFQRLTVFENIRLGVQAVHGSSFDLVHACARQEALRERTERVIERMNLSRIAGDVLSKLSYGDLRQVEVAVALATDPKVLLLDEPTSGLSPTETHQMIDLIRTLPAEVAILMIEHDMQVVFSVADRITVLYYGEVIASGPPDTIAGDARVQEVYLGVDR